jgi:hypothetical protein
MGLRKAMFVARTRPRAPLFSTLICLLVSIGCEGDAMGNQTGNPIDNQTNESQTQEAGMTPPISAPADSGAPPAPGQDAGGSVSVAKDAAAPPVVMSDAASVPGDAGGSANSDAASGDGGPAMSGATCLMGSGDFAKAGPYKFKQKNVTIGSKGQYTIVYPDPLEAACPHPFVVWGNGTFITGGTSYRPLQEHAASYGIITLASHSSSVGDGSFHTAGIDYMLAENKKSGGEFFGKLGERAGVSGHSQGGAGADRGATMHKSVKAIANVQGSFGTPPMSDAAFLCLTGTEDIQPTGCPMAVKAAKVPALSASYQGADHVSTTLSNGVGMDQYKRLYAAWFRCFLADDASACAMFKGGAQCPVCKDMGWAEIFANNY